MQRVFVSPSQAQSLKDELGSALVGSVGVMVAVSEDLFAHTGEARRAHDARASSSGR